MNRETFSIGCSWSTGQAPPGLFAANGPPMFKYGTKGSRNCRYPLFSHHSSSQLFLTWTQRPIWLSWHKSYSCITLLLWIKRFCSFSASLDWRNSLQICSVCLNLPPFTKGFIDLRYLLKVDSKEGTGKTGRFGSFAKVGSSFRFLMKCFFWFGVKSIFKPELMIDF